MLVPTPHNAAMLGDIADIVLMPGDPLRAKYIATKYLTDVFCYNEIRSMLGYTGKYKGVRISVQGSGMGVASMGIYSKELYEGYNVDTIIRIGSAGSLNDSVQLRDIVVSEEVLTDSNYLNINCKNLDIKPKATKILVDKLLNLAKTNNLKIKSGKTFTSDTFYSTHAYLKECAKTGAIAIEMETLALYVNAINANKKAIALFTISDNLIKNLGLSAIDRQNSFDEMLKLALELAINCK